MLAVEDVELRRNIDNTANETSIRAPPSQNEGGQPPVIRKGDREIEEPPRPHSKVN